MARRKEKESEAYDPWEYYQSIALTPEQQAANRAEVEQKVNELAASGFYERLANLIGTVELPYDKEELREDRD